MAALNFKDYWDAIGSDEMAKVLSKAGIKLQYARQFRIGVKVPGRLSALALIDAARKVTPGWEPDLELMLRGVDRSGATGPKIMPSAEFARSKRKAKGRQ
jgi:hypothetical protein